MDVRGHIEKVLKQAIVDGSDTSFLYDEIVLEDKISKYMDSLDFANVSIDTEEKLGLDRDLILEDQAFINAKTLKDLVDVYYVHYLGTDHDKI